ncbi:hypothetical protein KC343_g4021 [Hortaea werneckii]|uniref:BTB domain-containing protein n=1 Tax=Hortaea werneckii TaxID=91943 RepID=A0A3M7GM37_HORWE|nr:hypothetical protein KC352_g16308 [Hortaea werneckii]KAI7562062.1 hypothetical protein KC317_g8662 [Hortaea werneckii]KAI7608856.1 hypothetical protein KC346_g9439 [Hortaea werneckii]KAI7631450.1 hypothetical protein KC343_g4021 [Hortaea werneckii]KAI7657655.1 hypothetical protein KC319_g9457 [Hortaea werneckii]
MDNKATKSAEPDFAEALATDRLITVVVGKHTPFLVQQLLLESLSDYFVRALQRDRFSEGIHGELRIEGDDWNTWKALLHWLFKGMLSDEAKDDPSRLIDLWIVGDKYGVNALQNDAMYSLLKYLDIKRDDISLVTIKKGIDGTAPGTVMRRLLAEETLWALNYTHSTSYEDFVTWNAVGFVSDVLRAKDRHEAEGSQMLFRFAKKGALWKEFMLAGGGLGRVRPV